MKYTILVADDEREIRELLRLYLENEQYKVLEAEDGEAALEVFSREAVDLCILDIMMPKLDGYNVLRKIRENSNIPVIFLSAKDADAEKILGLNLGADAYVPKPFNPLLLVAKVNSHMRRYCTLGTSNGLQQCLKVQDLTLNLDACELKKGDSLIELTSVEFRIMRMLMKNPGKVFTKQQIYECGWEDTYMVADNNIMVCISKLRDKLADDSREYIKTIRGLGYRLEK